MRRCSMLAWTGSCCLSRAARALTPCAWWTAWPPPGQQRPGRRSTAQASRTAAGPPDRNPIEPGWATVQAERRRVAACTVGALHQACGPALAAITPQAAAGVFRHRGYGRPSSFTNALAQATARQTYAGRNGSAAVEPARPQRDLDTPPKYGQVGRVPVTAAVHRPARAAAIRAAPARAGAMCFNAEEARAARRDRLNAAAWHRTKLVRALFFYGRR